MPRFECWDDLEEPPEPGEGRIVVATDHADAALEFCDEDSLEDGESQRICVRDGDAIRCFEITLTKRCDVMEVRRDG